MHGHMTSEFREIVGVPQSETPLRFRRSCPRDLPLGVARKKHFTCERKTRPFHSLRGGYFTSLHRFQHLALHEITHIQPTTPKLGCSEKRSVFLTNSY